MQNFIRKYGPRSGQSQEQTRNQLRISFGKEFFVLEFWLHNSSFQVDSAPLHPLEPLREFVERVHFHLPKQAVVPARRRKIQRNPLTTWVISNIKKTIFSCRLTLAECNQNYEVMKRDRRKEVFEILMKHMDTGFASFISHIGFNTNYNAIDFARVLSLKLECKQVNIFFSIPTIFPGFSFIQRRTLPAFPISQWVAAGLLQDGRPRTTGPQPCRRFLQNGFAKSERGGQAVNCAETREPQVALFPAGAHRTGLEK